MEMAKVITAQYSYFADYRFKFIRPKQGIIDHFDGERRQFSEALFHCSPQARLWCQVDFDALWQSYKGERSRAVAALDYFHQNGWIELESKLMTEVYRAHLNSLSISAALQRLEAVRNQ